MFRFFGVFIHRNVDCTKGFNGMANLSGNGAGLAMAAGYGQVRGDGHPGSTKDPCVSWVTEAAVDFDMGPYTSIRALKFINRAVLSYREQEAPACMNLVYTQGGFLVDPLPCYSNASGQREAKPNGCLVATVPPEDWITHRPNRRLETMPINFPRVGPSAWDVTNLVQQRVNPSIGTTLPIGHGFMLVGTPIIVRRLAAEDNTRCSSMISNLRLTLTYNVPPSSGHAPPILK